MFTRMLKVTIVGLILAAQVEADTKAAPQQSPPSSQTPAPAPKLTDKEVVDAMRAGLAEAEKWKPFTTQEKDCSATLPGVPRREAHANGDHDSVGYILETGKNSYWLARQTYKFDVTKDRNPQQVLEDGCQAIVAGFRGINVTKKPIVLENKHPGLEVRFMTGPDKKTAMCLRVYRVGQVTYMLAVRGAPEFVQGTDASLFLNSFHLVNAK